MILTLDHVVIAVDNLDQAIQDYEALGFTVLRGGVHANRATHNALIAFSDGTYIELLAHTGEDPLPGMIDFSQMLNHGEGLAGFALRTYNLEAEAQRMKQAGFVVGEVVEGSREKEGRVMRWKLALIEDSFAPFLIQDVTPRTWRVPDDPQYVTHMNHAVGIPAVEFAVRDIRASWDRFTRLIGESPETPTSDYRTVGPIVLRQSSALASKYPLDERPDYPKPFAVHLAREETNNEAFTPERTHGVYFQHVTGIPPE